jgi:putative SOS response-associated peptidase YedK
MTFAGLWDQWTGSDGKAIRSFAIITTQANDLLSSLEHRMPALLSPDEWALWLGERSATAAELKALLKPYPSERMAIWPVSRRVGNVRNDGPDLFEPVSEA